MHAWYHFDYNWSDVSRILNVWFIQINKSSCISKNNNSLNHEYKLVWQNNTSDQRFFNSEYCFCNRLEEWKWFIFCEENTSTNCCSSSITWILFLLFSNFFRLINFLILCFLFLTIFRVLLFLFLIVNLRFRVESFYRHFSSFWS